NAATLVTESCSPGNGAFDPGETETVTFVVKNISGGAISNVKAQLLPTFDSAGVLPVISFISGKQTIGDMAKDASVNVTFTFLNTAPCGSSVTLTLQLFSGTDNDNQTNEGTIPY